jgi:hypothetical protein
MVIYTRGNPRVFYHRVHDSFSPSIGSLAPCLQTHSLFCFSRNSLYIRLTTGPTQIIRSTPVNNLFISQFSQNIKFNYTCFDRVIIRGYRLKFFSLACVALFLRAMGFSMCFVSSRIKRMSERWLPEILSAKKGGNTSVFTNATNRSSSQSHW